MYLLILFVVMYLCDVGTSDILKVSGSQCCNLFLNPHLWSHSSLTMKLHDTLFLFFLSLCNSLCIFFCLSVCNSKWEGLTHKNKERRVEGFSITIWAGGALRDVEGMVESKGIVAALLAPVLPGWSPSRAPWSPSTSWGLEPLFSCQFF